ncbi:MAG: SDR family oxidoreductase, partial [Clostridia bacterium]
MKTILVTGGSRGIGRAVVKAAAKNFNIAFTYFKNDKLADELVCALSPFCNISAYKCDISNAEEVKSVVDSVISRYKKIDVLVNNAGIADDCLFQDISNEAWRNMFAVNVDGAFYLCREVVPHMLTNGSGAIVNISSMWGEVGAAMETHYSASKAAVIGLTKALAKELAPSNITVNAVAPGAIDTDMMKVYSSDEIEALCREIPLGRLGSPEEVATATLFLADN